MENMQIVAVDSKNVEAQYVEMIVPLYSYGCERKVKKALSGLKGIYSVNVDYKQQKVTVWGICNKYDVLATMKSKRKEARFWNGDDFQMENSKPSFSITRSHTLSFKAWRKIFTRSLSF
ncbi:heavy metal-associated isoprenylated plant protein 28 [Euphorbia lathyris]|uniref:heavy metal-associated isoprenylated plant protein 28 n=1 Tax=Euphorbia lathyris TaxID=212925 RepID=UPI003313B1B8